MARKAKKTEATPAEQSAVEEQNATSVEEAVDSDSQASENSEATSYSPCGGVLQTERTKLGLSINEVAKQLRLSPKQIEALEQDDFSSLPESTIVKGFLRNYAKLLKIPSEPLTQAYMEMAPEQERYAFSLDPGINRKISDKKPHSYSRYYAIAFLLLLGFGVWFFYQSYIQKPSPVSPTPEVAETLPELALPMAERENASTQIEMPNQDAAENVALPAQPEQVQHTADNAEQVASVEDSESENQPVASASSETPVEESGNTNAGDQVEAENEPAQDALPPGKSRIQFTATQETWVSVVNANGKEVYNKILYPGHRDTVDVWQPREIVVGNAHGATLVVDGEKIDLAPYTRINVARVRLNR